MKKYKIAVSKNQKKFTLLLSSENEINARERVHQEWYSILSINEVSWDHEIGHKFIFQWVRNGKVKKWKIIWEDIFKIYLKLRKDLDYKVNILYDQDDKYITNEWKEKILKNLEAEYEIYKSLKKQPKHIKKTTFVENHNTSKNHHKDFYLKKELDNTYKLIEFVLQKLLNIIDCWEISNISLEQKEKLKNIYNSIISVKKSTNINKIKEIWELALLKIWNLELNELDKNKTVTSQKLLKETNKLLKEIWSSKQFVDKSKDISLIFSSFFNKINIFFEGLKEKEKKESIVIDKWSHSYFKTELLLIKYKDKLQQNNNEILKNIFLIFIFPEKREDIFIKRRIIKQNITLLEAKIRWINFSYTSVIK